MLTRIGWGRSIKPGRCRQDMQSRLMEAQPGVPPEKNIQLFQSLTTGCGTYWTKVRDYPFPTCLGSILCAFSRESRARAAALV
jgi:hypothetical protein